MTARVVVNGHDDEVRPGEEAAIPILVTNSSRIVDSFHIEVLGDLAPSAEVSPVDLSLFPDQQGAATVTVRVSDQTMLAGRITLAIKVTPATDPADSVVEETTVTVTAVPRISLALKPHRAYAKKRSRHRVVVSNTGNQAAEVALSGTDPDDELDIKCRPAAFLVAPASSVTATARVTAYQFVEGVERPFQITASVRGAGVRTADGSLMQRRTRRPWLIAAVGLAALALVGAGVLLSRAAGVRSHAGNATVALAGASATSTSSTTSASGPAASGPPAAAVAGSTAGGSGSSPSRGGAATSAGSTSHVSTAAAGGTTATASAPSGSSGGTSNASGGGSSPPPGPVLPAAYYATTSANLNLSSSGGSPVTVQSVTLPGGQWLVRATTDIVNWGTGDYARCMLVQGSTQVDASAAFVGTGDTFVEGIRNQALVNVPSGSSSTVSLHCQHDNSQAGEYVDAGADLLAQQTSGAQAATTSGQTQFNSTGGTYTAVDTIASESGAEVASAKASAVDWGADTYARCTLSAGGATVDGATDVIGGADSAVESIANLGIVTSGPVVQSCESDTGGTGAFADPGASLILHPEVAGTQVGRTTQDAPLSASGGTPSSVVSVTLGAGKWLLSWKATGVNWGQDDFVRCSLATPSAALPGGGAAYIGGAHSAAEDIAGLSTISLSESTTVTLRCSHDSAISGMKIDPGATVVAEPAGSLS